MANLNARKTKNDDKKSRGSMKSGSVKSSSNGSKKNINVEDGLSNKQNDEIGAGLIKESP